MSSLLERAITSGYQALQSVDKFTGSSTDVITSALTVPIAFSAPNLESSIALFFGGGVFGTAMTNLEKNDIASANRLTRNICAGIAGWSSYLVARSGTFANPENLPIDIGNAAIVGLATAGMIYLNRETKKERSKTSEERSYGFP